MNEFLEILKYLLPGAMVLVTSWYLVSSFLKNAEHQRGTELLMKNHEITIPLRLQAFERVTLFLERISLDSLLTRLNRPGMTAKQLHAELLGSIRMEFEHNLSQQIYMSAEAWEMVKNARAQMIKIINTAAEQTDGNLSAIELSKKIIEIMGDYPKSPTQTALDFLKKEVQTIY